MVEQQIAYCARAKLSFSIKNQNWSRRSVATQYFELPIAHLAISYVLYPTDFDKIKCSVSQKHWL